MIPTVVREIVDRYGRPATELTFPEGGGILTVSKLAGEQIWLETGDGCSVVVPSADVDKVVEALRKAAQ